MSAKRTEAWRAGLLAAVLVCFLAALSGAETRTTPVAAASDGTRAGEYDNDTGLGFKWGGDARTRIDISAPSDMDARVRLLGRLRIGANGTFADNKAFWGFRLETNANNAVTHDSTLAGGDLNNGATRGDNFGIGRVYLGIQPSPKVAVTIGRMANPFWTSEAVFDEDLDPPGVAFNWRVFEGGDADTIKNVNMALMWAPVRELGALSNDPYAILSQLRGQIGPVRAGVGLYYFDNLNAVSALGGVTTGATGMFQAATQVISTTGFFTEDQIAVVHGKVVVPFKISGRPFSIGGELFGNVSVSKENLGWEVRGDAEDLWSGRGHLLFRQVQQDATFAPWACSELGRGTGYRSGFEAHFQRPIVGPLNIGLTYFRMDRDRPLIGTVPGLSTGKEDAFQVDFFAPF
ncbi:MAG: putative porin [Armatimonadetes bacterium]|nr:putative porin [Armatimonadota bacterium]